MAKYSKISIIYNPNSTGNSEAMAKQLQKDLKRFVPTTPTECLPTDFAGHAQELAHDIAKSEKRPLIVSASGDGGYNEVVNGVMEAENEHAVCAVLPAGNANDHSRTMHNRPLLELIVRGRVVHLDLIKVTAVNQRAKTSRLAHSYVGLGLTPVVAVELNRHSLNAFKEAVLVIKVFFKYRPFEIMHRGQLLHLDSLLFANINQMAKVLTLAPENHPDDGKFEVIMFPSGSKVTLVRRLAQAATNRAHPPKQRQTYTFTTRKTMPMQLDGEVMQLPGWQRKSPSSPCIKR